MSVSLSAQHITKRYGGTVALADGNLTVASGEVLALLGANGSGKSTLSKIITGVTAPDQGRLLLDGQPVSFGSPQAARRRGITAVYQELSLIPEMSVAENIWLAHEPLGFGLHIRKRQVLEETRKLLALFAGTYSESLHPERAVNTLPPDERQIVEILKAVSLQPRLMILDEATASLDSQQVNRLFELVTDWKKQGMAVVFVSHRMDEIFRVADRATVLRNGSTVGDASIQDTTRHELVEMMVGNVVAPEKDRSLQPQQTALRLQVNNLTTPNLHAVDLDLHEGELLGIGGLHGQGQEDLLLALFGALPYSGSLKLAGKVIRPQPRDAMQAGIAFVPGDRGSEGLLLIRSILDNLQLPGWSDYGIPLRMSRAQHDAQQIAADLNIVMSGLQAPVNSLSGGNAQKVVIGKWLLRKPRLLLLNDPTKGVDVGAKGEFYRLIADLRARGTSILFYSSDDEELLSLCDRILVMHDGRVHTELSGEQLTHSNLVAASMGSA